MQYELLANRGLQPDMSMPSKTFLYFYSSYKKEREERAANRTDAKGRRFVPFGH